MGRRLPVFMNYKKIDITVGPKLVTARLESYSICECGHRNVPKDVPYEFFVKVEAADRFRAEYRRAVEIEPKNALAHHHLGRALRDSKELLGAIAEFCRATGCVAPTAELDLPVVRVTIAQARESPPRL